MSPNCEVGVMHPWTLSAQRYQCPVPVNFVPAVLDSVYSWVDVHGQAMTKARRAADTSRVSL